MEKIVFTNGCFDIIHPGHVDLLNRARGLGTKLIVGINSDRSVRSIKGETRPIQNENERKTILENLRCVDEVIVFDALTPEELIKKIKPDVLVKGGDWKESEIVGADFVRQNGGEVYSLPLKDGYSSSRIVEKISNENAARTETTTSGSSENSVADLIKNSFDQHLDVFKKVRSGLIYEIAECADLFYETFQNGGKILICGNGGSAADAQHIAAEFVGRYETERKALPAIALTTDTSALTALANDYDFEKVYARQVEALAKEGDCLLAISTSGTSPNIIAAAMTARNLGCRVVGMTGAKGKKLAGLTDRCILIPAERTARIQEAHIAVAHIWCEIIDTKTANKIQ